MDFVVELPSSRGYKAIFVVMDRLMKNAYFSPLKHGFKAKIVTTVFMESVLKLHDFPVRIMSDCDPIFLSTFWRQLMQFGGTKLHYSSAYHPQSDGQMEVVNRCLEQYLHAFTLDYPNLWSSYLSWAELYCNTTFHMAIRMMQHQALYGVNPKLLPVYNQPRLLQRRWI